MNKHHVDIDHIIILQLSYSIIYVELNNLLWHAKPWYHALPQCFRYLLFRVIISGIYAEQTDENLKCLFKFFYVLSCQL